MNYHTLMCRKTGETNTKMESPFGEVDVHMGNVFCFCAFL